MIYYSKIKKLIEAAFRDYITEEFQIKERKRPYFFWNMDFLKKEKKLSFDVFFLSAKKREIVNSLGSKYFDDNEVVFEIEKNAQRYNLHVKNIHKLFSEEEKSGQVAKYDYLKEFVFWDILRRISDGNEDSQHLINKQWKNFIYAYVEYLISNEVSLSDSFFNDYQLYSQTSQGKYLIDKIKELEAKGYNNETLLKRINELFILKNEAKKIHFVFSINGGEEKEELRQLLDIMGRKDAGNLYRGQACASWQLNASITREPKYLRNEAEMYYEILSIKPDAFSNDSSVYERLITMQHFGMPTRLLDITRNPLVAIFFACNNHQEKNRDGVVYTFSPEKKEFLNFEDDRLKFLSELFTSSNMSHNSSNVSDFLENVWFVRGVAKNPRISIQSGDFIFVGNGKDVSSKLHNLPSFFIVIDAPTKEVLLEQLDSLNIHGGSVYPDLAHMSNYIGEKYRKSNDLLFESPLENMEFTNEIKERDLGDVFLEIWNDPPKISEEKRKKYDLLLNTKPKDSPRIELINKYDFDEFWNKNVLKEVDLFAGHKNLKSPILKNVIESYLFTGKYPLRDSVEKAMNYKFPLKHRFKIDDVTKEIVEFANRLKSDYFKP